MWDVTSSSPSGCSRATTWASTWGTFSGQQWLQERSFSACTLLRRLRRLDLAVAQRALRFALMSHPGTAALAVVATLSPGWSLTAPAQTESGRRNSPAQSSEPWEALLPLSAFVYPWSRMWSQLQHWIGLGFNLTPVCKLWYCLFKNILWTSCGMLASSQHNCFEWFHV